MKLLYIILLGAMLVLFPQLSYSYEYPIKDSDANIVGHVVNKHTNEHLPYITVMLEGTTIGTTTDATGHYHLVNLPEGNFTIKVSAIGYKAITREVSLKKGKTLEMNFEIEEDLVFLEGVVVSANRSETTRRTAPTLVNVMSIKTFEYTNSCNLAQGLNFQPGVRVENNCQNCGFQQVRINGLDGPYTQILIDSRPIFTALSGVYGLEQLPANMIDRVEVMRGGGSALFGSSAIAGGRLLTTTRCSMRHWSPMTTKWALPYSGKTGKEPDMTTTATDSPNFPNSKARHWACVRTSRRALIQN